MYLKQTTKISEFKMKLLKAMYLKRNY